MWGTNCFEVLFLNHFYLIEFSAFPPWSSQLSPFCWIYVLNLSQFTLFSWGKIWFKRFALCKENYISQLLGWMWSSCADCTRHSHSTSDLKFIQIYFKVETNTFQSLDRYNLKFIQIQSKCKGVDVKQLCWLHDTFSSNLLLHPTNPIHHVNLNVPSFQYSHKREWIES